MNDMNQIVSKIGVSPVNGPQHTGIQPDTVSFEASDGAQFRAVLEKKMHEMKANAVNPADGNKVSLGDKILDRANHMAGELKSDQAYVSKMLEQATRNADSMQLMRAMMALNDYQMRVQFVSKTASKATQALDQLTKLQ